MRPAAAARAVAGSRRAGSPRVQATAYILADATRADADAIHALIVAHLAEGHLLPRERGEIAVHAHRFVVAVRTIVSSPAPSSRRSAVM